MINMISKNFENLAQRSIYYFLATFPSFRAIGSPQATESQQKKAYDFIRSIYEKLYDDPTLLGLKLEQDDSFDDWEPQKIKLKLAPKIRGNIKKVEEFIYTIYQIVTMGKSEEDTIIIGSIELPLKPSIIKQLGYFGIQTHRSEESYLHTFPIETVKGLQLLAKISAENVKPSWDGKQKFYLLFSRGVFDVQAPYTREIYRSMFDDKKAMDKLIDYLDEAGYTRIDNKESGNSISLDYIRNYGNPDEALKWAWGERTRGGVEFVYEEIRKNQVMFSLRVPYFGEVLKNADKMNAKLKSFVVNTSKKCDGCRYCVQTDKTGKRPFIAVKVDEYKICPLFCGFQYRWRTINEGIVDNAIEMLKFIDEIFEERKYENTKY